MDTGELLTDEIVIGLVEEQLAGNSDGRFIFDGFPRNLAQAYALSELLDKCGQSLDAGIEMAVDDDASLRVRLLEYYKKTSPLIGYYYAKGKLQSIDGLNSMDGVAGAIKMALAKVDI